MSKFSYIINIPSFEYDSLGPIWVDKIVLEEASGQDFYIYDKEDTVKKLELFKYTETLNSSSENIRQTFSSTEDAPITLELYSRDLSNSPVLPANKFLDVITSSDNSGNVHHVLTMYTPDLILNGNLYNKNFLNAEHFGFGYFKTTNAEQTFRINCKFYTKLPSAEEEYLLIHELTIVYKVSNTMVVLDADFIASESDFVWQYWDSTREKNSHYDIAINTPGLHYNTLSKWYYLGAPITVKKNGEGYKQYNKYNKTDQLFESATLGNLETLNLKRFGNLAWTADYKLSTQELWLKCFNPTVLMSTNEFKKIVPCDENTTIDLQESLIFTFETKSYPNLLDKDNNPIRARYINLLGYRATNMKLGYLVNQSSDMIDALFQAANNDPNGKIYNGDRPFYKKNLWESKYNTLPFFEDCIRQDEGTIPFNILITKDDSENQGLDGTWGKTYKGIEKNWSDLQEALNFVYAKYLSSLKDNGNHYCFLLAMLCDKFGFQYYLHNSELLEDYKVLLDNIQYIFTDSKYRNLKYLYKEEPYIDIVNTSKTPSIIFAASTRPPGSWNNNTQTEYAAKITITNNSKTLYYGDDQKTNWLGCIFGVLPTIFNLRITLEDGKNDLSINYYLKNRFGDACHNKKNDNYLARIACIVPSEGLLSDISGLNKPNKSDYKVILELGPSAENTISAPVPCGWKYNELTKGYDTIVTTLAYTATSDEIKPKALFEKLSGPLTLGDNELKRSSIHKDDRLTSYYKISDLGQVDNLILNSNVVYVLSWHGETSGIAEAILIDSNGLETSFDMPIKNNQSGYIAFTVSASGIYSIKFKDTLPCNVWNIGLYYVNSEYTDTFFDTFEYTESVMELTEDLTKDLVILPSGYCFAEQNVPCYDRTYFYRHISKKPYFKCYGWYYFDRGDKDPKLIKTDFLGSEDIFNSTITKLDDIRRYE